MFLLFPDCAGLAKEQNATTYNAQATRLQCNPRMDSRLGVWAMHPQGELKARLPTTGSGFLIWHTQNSALGDATE